MEPKYRSMIEISQQQCAILCACVLMAAFLLFLIGHSVGKKKVACEGCSQNSGKSELAFQGASKDQLTQMSTFTDRSITSDASIAADKYKRHDESISHDKLTATRAHSFNTKESAQAFLNELANRHITATLVTRQSKTQSQKIYEWFQVIIQNPELQHERQKEFDKQSELAQENGQTIDTNNEFNTTTGAILQEKQNSGGQEIKTNIIYNHTLSADALLQ